LSVVTFIVRSMSPARSTATARRAGFTCAECGATVVKWAGRCPQCQAWGTLQEAAPSARGQAKASLTVSTPARPIATVDATAAIAVPTGVEELDRVLGGGLVPGAVVLLAGEPGVGKSTLLLTAAARCAQGGQRVLIVSGEESAEQVRLRAGRTGALHANLWLATESDLGAVLAHLEQVKPDIFVLDSVQTITTEMAEGAAGGVAQVREVTAALTRMAKARGVTTILVGHVTKDGAIAGPRTLEHLVDVVLHFEGERHSSLRMVRAVKNRYGAADEVGCFELGEDGISGITDPSGLFLSRAGAGDEPVAGTCVTVAMEGRRPLVAEVQALLIPVEAPQKTQRGISGLDGARVAMMLAVLDRHGPKGGPRGPADVFASTVGGVRISEPAVDLAVLLALNSARIDRPNPPGLVAVGEVGLAGDVRRVTGIGRRVSAAARLGFTHALVPRDPGPLPKDVAGMKIIEVSDIRQAVLARDGVVTPSECFRPLRSV
jgi:DNA repair protein RadA/Sms